MLSHSLLSLGAALILPIASASSPSCTPSEYEVSKAKAIALSELFCEEVETAGFESHNEFYTPPWISFNYTKGASTDSCNLATCKSVYTELMTACKFSFAKEISCC